MAFYTGLTQSVNEFVSLKPNGDSSSVMRVSQFDRHHFIDYSTRNLKSTLRWLDDRGRELPSCTYTHAGQRYCNARLIDPPLANEVSLEWLNYTQIEDAPAAAQKEGNRWTYEGHRQFDAWRTDCDVTVELPRGATVASCEPQPLMWWQLGDTIRLEFLGTVKKMEPFHYKIVYELPNEAEAEKPPQ